MRAEVGCCWGLGGGVSHGYKRKRREGKVRYHADREVEEEVGLRRSVSCWWREKKLQMRGRRERGRWTGWEGMDAESDLSPSAIMPEGRGSRRHRGDGLEDGAPRLEWRESDWKNHLRLVSVWGLRR